MREPNQVSGSAILRDVRQAYQDRYHDAIAAQDKRVAIVRFTPGPDASPEWRAKMDASEVSANEKTKNIGALGYHMDPRLLPDSAKPEALERILRELNEDPTVSGVIVQYPPPSPAHGDLVTKVLDPAKDVDGLLGPRSLQTAPATSDGIVRVAAPFLDGRPTVAVVGSDGFIGQGVTNLLRGHDVDIMPLEYGDDLRQALDADLVISVTGNPRILGVEHLSPDHRLVIDSGFVPQPDGILSDVQREAASIPQRITPVPGGIGPVEMAVLLDRFVQKDVDPALGPWRLILPEK